MTQLLDCVFCEESDKNLVLLTDETLKKCRVIVKQRKLHNLKYKDVVLPVELFEGGYHRQCYKSFTGLIKKYYSEKVEASGKSTQKKKFIKYS